MKDERKSENIIRSNWQIIVTGASVFISIIYLFFRVTAIEARNTNADPYLLDYIDFKATTNAKLDLILNDNREMKTDIKTILKQTK